jgi:hypothetical protein
MGLKSYSIDKVFSKRIKMLEYPHLPLDVKELVDYTVMNNLKQNSILRLRKDIKPLHDSLWSLPWTDIIELRQALADNNLEKAINIVYKINKYQFLQLGIFNIYAAYLWIAHQFKDMMEIEIEQLSFDMDNEEKEAGAEELQDFGYVVALDGLAGGDVLKYDAYLKLPYSKVFRKLCLDKTRYEINKNMQNNASRKLTTNS